MNHDLEGKIRERAHRLWEADGRQHGRDAEHWAEAERQVMDEEGLGEPVGGGGEPEIEPGNRPEPQPEIPADPLRNPELIAPRTDPEYPATPGPQEMPADRSPQPEIPAEPGIAEAPSPAPGPAMTAPGTAPGPAATAAVRGRGGKKAALIAGGGSAAPTEPTAAAEAKGRGGRGGGKNKGSSASF